MRERPLLWIFISALNIDLRRHWAKQYAKAQESCMTLGVEDNDFFKFCPPPKWKEQHHRVLSQMNSRGESRMETEGQRWRGWGEDVAKK